jgi:hypothetical protein
MDDRHWNDDDDEDDEYPFGDWLSEVEEWDIETSCVVCGEGDCLDNCQCCGMPLCHMHAELGVGFCPDCPTVGYHPDYMPLTFRERLHDTIKHLSIRIHCWLHPLPSAFDDEIPF